MIKWTRPSPSIFAYCMQSKTGWWEGLGMSLIQGHAPWKIVMHISMWCAYCAIVSSEKIAFAGFLEISPWKFQHVCGIQYTHTHTSSELFILEHCSSLPNTHDQSSHVRSLNHQWRMRKSHNLKRTGVRREKESGECSFLKSTVIAEHGTCGSTLNTCICMWFVLSSEMFIITVLNDCKTWQ